MYVIRFEKRPLCTSVIFCQASNHHYKPVRNSLDLLVRRSNVKSYCPTSEVFSNEVDTHTCLTCAGMTWPSAAEWWKIAHAEA